MSMSTPDIVILTTARAETGREEEVLDALRDVAAAARERPGCVDYRIVRSASDAASTVNVERWSSKEARDTFLAGPEAQRFSAVVSGAFAGSPEPAVYQAID